MQPAWARAWASLGVASLALLGGACALDEHASDGAIPVLEVVALSLDEARSDATVAQLRDTCAQVDDWVATGKAGRDGELIQGVCETALGEDDWNGAHNRMLGLFPYAERQKHLRP